MARRAQSLGVRLFNHRYWSFRGFVIKKNRSFSFLRNFSLGTYLKTKIQQSRFSNRQTKR